VISANVRGLRRRDQLPLRLRARDSPPKMRSIKRRERAQKVKESPSRGGKIASSQGLSIHLTSTCRSKSKSASIRAAETSAAARGSGTTRREKPTGSCGRKPRLRSSSSTLAPFQSSRFGWMWQEIRLAGVGNVRPILRGPGQVVQRDLVKHVEGCKQEISRRPLPFLSLHRGSH